MNEIKGICLGSAWVDLDQDGDLDLLIGRYAPEGKQVPENQKGGLLVFLNTGLAPAVPNGQKAKPLSVVSRDSRTRF